MSHTPEELQTARDVIDELAGGHKRAIEAIAANIYIGGWDEADRIAMTFDELMEAAKNYVENGEYFSTGDSQVDLPDEFWEHYEALMDLKVPEDSRYSFFTCAC